MSKTERETMEQIKSQLLDKSAELLRFRTEAGAEIEKMKKEVENQRSTAQMWMESNRKAENELDAAHSLLDGLPQAPPREIEGEKNSYSRKEIQLTTRLASWIAKVAFSEAFSKMGIK